MTGRSSVATAVVPGVWRLDLGYVNAYLVEDDPLTLVDAGMPYHARALRDGIREAGFEPVAVRRAVLTHYDLDHVGALDSLTGLEEIYAGERDARLVAGTDAPPLTGRKSIMQRLVDPLREPPSVPVSPLEDGEEVGAFEAVHTPGHTPGHTAFVSESLGIAFVGDLVTNRGDSISVLPWFLHRDRSKLLRSVSRLRDRLGAVDGLAPGHGKPVTEGGAAGLGSLCE